MNLPGHHHQPSIAALTSIALLLLGCSHSRDKAQASAVIQQTLRIRTAPMPEKSEQIRMLRDISCSAPRVRAARDTCADAFAHHVSGWRLGQRIERMLDAGPHVDKQQAAKDLLEMNIEVQASRQQLANCDRAIDDLKHHYQLH